MYQDSMVTAFIQTIKTDRADEKSIQFFIGKISKLDLSSDDVLSIFTNALENNVDLAVNEIIRHLIHNNQDWINCLSRAIRNCNFEQFQPLLELSDESLKKFQDHITTENWDINLRDQDGYSLLSRSCEKGDLEITSLLLARGSEPNKKNKESKQRPMHFAATNGNAKLIPLLVEKGANIFTLDADNNTPLILAIMHQNDEMTRLLLNTYHAALFQNFNASDIEYLSRFVTENTLLIGATVENKPIRQYKDRLKDGVFTIQEGMPITTGVLVENLLVMTKDQLHNQDAIEWLKRHHVLSLQALAYNVIQKNKHRFTEEVLSKADDLIENPVVPLHEQIKNLTDRNVFLNKIIDRLGKHTTTTREAKREEKIYTVITVTAIASSISVATLFLLGPVQAYLSYSVVVPILLTMVAGCIGAMVGLIGSAALCFLGYLLINKVSPLRAKKSHELNDWPEIEAKLNAFLETIQAEQTSDVITAAYQDLLEKLKNDECDIDIFHDMLNDLIEQYDEEIQSLKNISDTKKLASAYSNEGLSLTLTKKNNEGIWPSIKTGLRNIFTRQETAEEAPVSQRPSACGDTYTDISQLLNDTSPYTSDDEQRPLLDEYELEEIIIDDDNRNRNDNNNNNNNSEYDPNQFYGCN